VSENELTPLSRQVVDTLKRQEETVAAAESCTGGGITAALTAISGSSAVLWGGIVSYHNDAKIGVLGVDPRIIREHGAVSRATALAMAWGVRTLSGADRTVAVTGVAGPDGGTPEKPVGTVWIAWTGPGGTPRAKEFHFDGNRDAIRSEAVKKALEGILEGA
jgi:nicotinamide-nucleotide amidase